MKEPCGLYAPFIARDIRLHTKIPTISYMVYIVLRSNSMCHTPACESVRLYVRNMVRQVIYVQTRFKTKHFLLHIINSQRKRDFIILQHFWTSITECIWHEKVLQISIAMYWLYLDSFVYISGGFGVYICFLSYQLVSYVSKRHEK